MGHEREDWIRDKESARRIEDRTQHSTAAKFSAAPPARVLDYYEYHAVERLTCPVCGWSGHAENASIEHHTDLFDLSCPRCEKMLLVVGLPTVEQTRQAAAAGNPEAISELTRIEQSGTTPTTDEDAPRRRR